MELANGSLPLLKRDSWLCWDSASAAALVTSPWPAKLMSVLLQAAIAHIIVLAKLHTYPAFALPHSDAGDILFASIGLSLKKWDPTTSMLYASTSAAGQAPSVDRVLRVGMPTDIDQSRS